VLAKIHGYTGEYQYRKVLCCYSVIYILLSASFGSSFRHEKTETSDSDSIEKKELPRYYHSLMCYLVLPQQSWLKRG